QDVVIDLRPVRAQGQPEAVLARRRAVAGAGVAPGPGQDRLDVVPEAPGLVPPGVLDRDGRAGGPAVDGGGGRGVAVADGRHGAVGLDGRHPGVIAGKTGPGRKVTDPRMTLPALDEEPLAGMRAVEPGRGREQGDLGRA